MALMEGFPLTEANSVCLPLIRATFGTSVDFDSLSATSVELALEVGSGYVARVLTGREGGACLESISGCRTHIFSA